MTPFASIIQSAQPVLVDFFAEWCGPCRTMAPILSEVKSNFGDKLKVIKIDVDKNPNAVRTYGIKGVPTLLLFLNGQIKWQQSGVVPAKELIRIVAQYC